MGKKKGKSQKPSLYDLTPAELESFFLSIGEKSYRARQVMDFLYLHPVDSFDEMTNLPLDLRERLSETLILAPIVLRETVEAPDGTVKHGYEVEGPPNRDILLESVWMPAESTDAVSSGKDRFTLCISSQLGCAAKCGFCATGKLGLHAQLSMGQIVYQVVHALKMYGKLPDTVLFMGMGEPMHNLDAVEKAVEIFTHPEALGMSPRRIVVSSCGEIERLDKFRRKFPRVRIAISLNAATDDLRSRLMPINETFGLDAIRSFIKAAEEENGEKITLEYVMLGGINDTDSQLAALVRFLRPIADRVKVNLIQYNPVDKSDFRQPKIERIREMQNALREIGVMTFIRRNRGRSVSAACGQLAGSKL